MDNCAHKGLACLWHLIDDISASGLDSTELLIASCRENFKFFPGSAFLYNICNYATMEQVRWLKSHHYFGTFWFNLYGRTPLMIAAEIANVLTLNKMLEAGFDVHATDVNGNNALSYAASNSYYSNDAIERNKATLVCMTMLLEAGINVDSRNKRQMTVLHESIVHGSDALNRSLLLLTYGADPNARDLRSTTPATAANFWYGVKQLTHTLRSYGANLERLEDLMYVPAI